MGACTRIERKGTKRTIHSVIFADGSSPAVEFLDPLTDDKRRKLDTLFERMGDHGELRNKEKFKKVEDSDGLFEFKSHQIRVLCFFGTDNGVYLLLGLIKKSDKLKKSEVERAEEYRRMAKEQLGV